MNIHIGLPGLFPKLLESFSKTDFAKAHSVEVLSTVAWQRHFLPFINSKKDLLQDLSLRAQAEDALEELSDRAEFIISQHDLLGSPEGCFFKDRLLPFTEARITRLVDLFEDRPLEFHVIITNQVDYFRLTIEPFIEKMNNAAALQIPSWSSLVERIQSAAPNVGIHVWDFERPDLIAGQFMMGILEQADSRFADEINAHLVARLNSIPVVQDDPETRFLPQDLEERLDLQYERDLEILSDLDGIILKLGDDARHPAWVSSI